MGTTNNYGEVNAVFCNMILNENAFMPSEDGELDPSLDGNNNASVASRPENYVIDLISPDQEPAISWFNFLLLFWPVLTHVYDVINDIVLASEYFTIGTNHGNVYGGLTIAFIMVPTMTNIWINSLLKRNSSMEQIREKDRSRMAFIEIARQQAFCISVFIFQLVPQLRYWRIIRSAWRVRKCNGVGDRVGARWYYEKMLQEQQDLALLDVIDSFLESAPQLILQLFILLNQETAITTTMWFRIFGGCVTLTTLGWTMTRYHRAIRFAQQNKAKISYCGSLILFIAHFGTITTRVLLISIASVIWPLFTALGFMLIWIGWIIWLTLQDGVSKFCRDKNVLPHAQATRLERIRTVSFAAVLAVVYRFTFVNLSENRSRLRLWMYHILCGLENFIIILFWFTSSDAAVHCNCFSLYCLIIIAVVFYFVGIGALAIYYMFLHPSIRYTFCVGLGTSSDANGQL